MRGYQEIRGEGVEWDMASARMLVASRTVQTGSVFSDRDDIAS